VPRLPGTRIYSKGQTVNLILPPFPCKTQNGGRRVRRTLGGDSWTELESLPGCGGRGAPGAGVGGPPGGWGAGGVRGVSFLTAGSRICEPLRQSYRRSAPCPLLRVCTWEVSGPKAKVSSRRCFISMFKSASVFRIWSTNHRGFRGSTHRGRRGEGGQKCIKKNGLMTVSVFFYRPFS
jgi:hypothetical protein